MKKKEKNDLKLKSEKELKTIYKEIKDEIFKLRQDHALKKLKNTSILSKKRKEISVVLTYLREREDKKNENI